MSYTSKESQTPLAPKITFKDPTFVNVFLWYYLWYYFLGLLVN